jgi:restriction endonuclease
MEFQFDANQEYQLKAITAVADIFTGQPHRDENTLTLAAAGKGDEERPLLYLVRETKDTHDRTKLRPHEDRKITCGERHFEALGVDYRLVVSAGEVP